MKKNLFNKIIIFLIQIIEKIEYRKISLDENDISKKILNTFQVKGIKISTDTGFQSVSNLHITQPYTVWRIETENGKWLECADNHIVFDNNFDERYVKNLEKGDSIQTDSGISKIYKIKKTSNKVSMFDITVESKHHRFYSNGILSHNTICSSIYLAWYLLFNFDKNALVLSNKGDTTREIVDKAKVILESLPFFLKPGVIKNDVFNMKFDNGCRLVAQSTTKKAGIGFTIHLLFLDEFAHIHQNFVDSFYENVYPTLSSSKVSRIIITSTPSGFNKFYDIYKSAEDGISEFKSFRVDWWQVPGRDNDWMRREIANLGSEDAFNRQYGNQFVSGDNLLLGPAEIRKVQEAATKYIHHDFDDLDDIEVRYNGFLTWNPDFNTDDTQDDTCYWVFSIDIAEGSFRDYSIINVFKIIPMGRSEYKNLNNPGSYMDFFKLEQVALFRSNEHSVEEFSKILYTLAFTIFNPENVKLMIEWNMFGSELVKNLQTVFPQHNEFDEEMIVKFKHRIDAKVTKFGLKIKPDNKTMICQKFRKYVKEGRISINEIVTTEEAKSFGRTPGGSYKAMRGHDDCVMSCINVSEFLNTMDYSDFAEEIYEVLEHEAQKDIDAEIQKGSKDDGSLYYDIYDLVNAKPEFIDDIPKKKGRIKVKENEEDDDSLDIF